MTPLFVPALSSTHHPLPDGVDETSVSAPHRNYEGRLIPVVLEIDETKLAALDPELRACIEQIAAAGEERLAEWETFDISYPESRFTDGTAVIQLGDLFKAPDNSELSRLALDEEGNSVSLTDEQRKQIRKTGKFVIPSEDYPGQDHVWKVSRILQKGSDNIQRTLEGHQATILDQLTGQIPQRLSRNGTVSVGRGAHNIYQGLRGILGFVTGFNEEIRKHSDSSVDRQLKAKKEAMIREYLVNYQQGDDRLYIEEISESLKDILQAMEDDWSSYKNANRQSWEQTLLAELAGKDTSGSDLTQQADVALREKINHEYRTFIENYSPLQEAEPGYGILLVNAHRAREADNQVKGDFVDIPNSQRRVIQQRIKEEHRIRSRSDRWLQTRVDEEYKKFCKDELWLKLQEKVDQLEERGLELEAAIYGTVLAFKRDVEPVFRKALEAEKVAARTFEFKTHMWRTKDWVRLENERPDEPYYTAQKHYTSEVRTDQLFWRLRLIKHQTAADFKNGLHSILVSNLWNGSAGLKSLVLKDPFYPKHRMDPKTGEIVPDEYSKTHTLRSRYQALWNDVAQARKEFEEQPDTGILPKKFSRWLNTAYHNGIKGAGGSTLLFVGQPLVTTGNLLLSTVATVASPLWAPMRSGIKYTFAPIIYDANSPRESDNQKIRRFFPIFVHAIYDVGIVGAGQTTLALSSAAVIHPATAGVTGLYAELRKWTRTGYDFAMAHTLLKWGRQPANDTWLSKRIRGPGLSHNYFFQVRPEIAVLALQAHLEKIELQYFRKDVTEAITEPSRQFHQFFDDLVRSIGHLDLTQNPTTKRLKTAETTRLKELKDNLRERETALSNVSRLSVQTLRIRQVAADLDETLKIAEQLVTSFYEEKIQPFIDEEKTLSFWNGENLPVGDFSGLARRYLATVFSSNFLEPLEITDQHFVIEVSNPSAKAFLRNLINPSE